jgi:deoxyribodipyrimidine photo-lyase
MEWIPASRLTALNDAPLRGDRDYVVYWMVSQRRLEWNFALDQALHRARWFGVPLIVFEGLRVGYRWSSPRHHRFALDGMREHRDRLAGTPVTYLPYVEPEAGAGKGLLAALASRACVVVTDDYPVFFLSAMQGSAGRGLDVRLEKVDSNGLLPMRAAERTFTAAVHFRRHLHKRLPDHLAEAPDPAPLQGLELPRHVSVDRVVERWPMAPDSLLDGDASALAGLPLEYEVGVTHARGGAAEGRRRLESFLVDGLDDYLEGRNHPDRGSSSRLSPWLHWGHLSAHEVFHRVVEREQWSPARLLGQVTAKREGWWGMGPAAEAFLEELVTWRELGFNFACEREDYDRYESLPAWALATLAAHEGDPRAFLYDLDAFDAADTHDPLWNAAQRELRQDGVIHNYLRMLWGKKILEWSPDPRAALEVMIELNNRYALDGRDPNSYSGIFWVLGRFDRGWPERPVYGTVRSMSSDSTRRKVELGEYMKRFSKESF